MRNEEFKLFSIETLSKYDKFTKMFNTENLETESVLPDHLKSTYQNDLSEAVFQLSKKDKQNYVDKFYKNRSINDKLYSAKIDILAYRVFLDIEKNEVIRKNLKSFKPYKGFCNRVSYSLTGTSTGRLIVNQGSPNILTLPNRCRKIFESRWSKDGMLISIDFKNLEPRLIRKILNQEVKGDIYEEILDKIEFKKEIDRSLIKRATISVLYGKMTPIEGLSKERSDIILQKTKEYFNIDAILDIAENSNNDEYRKNYFGRPLKNLDELKQNKIINNFIQSSAVDISLMYFVDLIDKLNIEMSKPIFVIHDALVIDVHKEYVEELKNIVNLGYESESLGNFPIDITNFTTGEKLID